jgi:hypothetical protein
MVFMGVDNLPEEEDLTDEADADLREMREIGSSETLDILVQRHDRAKVTREHVGVRSAFSIDDENEVTATNGQALIAFVRWALGKAHHRPQDQTLLILWGHAHRFTFGAAKTPTGVDALDFAELRGVLSSLVRACESYLGPRTRPPLDILGFDACDLSSLEIAVQVHPYAEYLLASQITVPLPGWPYDRILERIKQPQGERLMGAAELGTYIVRRFCEHYHAQERAVSLTMLDLKRVHEIEVAADQLARRVAIAIADDADEQRVVLDLFRQSQAFDGKPFVDAADLCLNLARFSSDADVVRTAERLGNLLVTPQPVPPKRSVTGEGRPFVLEHGRNAARSARLHGVNLYAPHVAPDHDADAASHFYNKLEFTQRTLWGELVRALALPD